MPSRHLKQSSSLTRHFASNGNATPHPAAVGAAVAVGALAISALINRFVAKKAERNNPPAGKFVEVEGVRLHYIERGEGEPLVLPGIAAIRLSRGPGQRNAEGMHSLPTLQ